jgi:hypothetical protein
VTHIGWPERLPETLELVGEKAGILVDDLKGGSIVVNRRGREERETFPPLPATHWGIVENFVRHCTAGVPLACDGEEGRKSTVILDIVSGLPHDGTVAEVDYSRDTPPARAGSGPRHFLG